MTSAIISIVSVVAFWYLPQIQPTPIPKVTSVTTESISSSLPLPSWSYSVAPYAIQLGESPQHSPALNQQANTLQLNKTPFSSTNLSLPSAYLTKLNLPTPAIWQQPIPLLKASFAQPNNKLDSLGPKATFTEYKLVIRKENSEQEIAKLKEELASYGIYMDVLALKYDNENKIKRFKGKFRTDSLFCGTTMNNYQFDVQGSFREMEFIFRVADNKNLKYLKIQSESFEELIECYDDEVLTNAKQAQRIHQRIEARTERVEAEIARTMAEVDRVINTQINNELSELKDMDDVWIDNLDELSEEERLSLMKKLEINDMDSLEPALKRYTERVLTDIDWDGIHLSIENSVQQLEDLDLDMGDLYIISKDKTAKALENMQVEMKVLQERLEHDVKRKLRSAERSQRDRQIELRERYRGTEEAARARAEALERRIEAEQAREEADAAREEALEHRIEARIERERALVERERAEGLARMPTRQKSKALKSEIKALEKAAEKATPKEKRLLKEELRLKKKLLKVYESAEENNSAN